MSQPSASQPGTKSSTALHFGQPPITPAGSNGFGARSTSPSIPAQSHDWHSQRKGLTGRTSSSIFNFRLVAPADWLRAGPKELDGNEEKSASKFAARSWRQECAVDYFARLACLRSFAMSVGISNSGWASLTLDGMPRAFQLWTRCVPLSVR